MIVIQEKYDIVQSVNQQTKKARTMNEDSLLFILKNHLSDALDIPRGEIHMNSSLEEDLTLDDESFEFFLIDLQDAEPLINNIRGLVLSDITTVGDLIDAIEEVIVP